MKKRNWRLMLRRVLNLVFSRLVITVTLVLLQVFWLFSVFHWLDAYSTWLNSEGLALGYALLCRQAGISCALVKGTLGDTPHCWNQVTLDGETYFLDLTRSDPEESFLLPAEELLAAGYQWSGAPETAPADTAAEKE